MTATIQNLFRDLSPDEQRLFEANARIARRKPGQHLKAIIFGENTGSRAKPRAKKDPAK